MIFLGLMGPAGVLGASDPPIGLSLSEVLNRVLTHSEAVQIQVLEVEISRKLHEAEKGIFEPEVVGSVDWTDSQRPTTLQQQLGLGFSPVAQLTERNTIYNGGLEFLLPTGARFQTGYTLRRLNNNLQPAGLTEYETFIGTSLVQPLLKNAGVAATVARLRLSSLASEVAFQEYRRALMLIVGQAETAYWELYVAQEAERLSEESVELAEKILRDNQARWEVGVMSELEVLQAEAGLSLRESRRNEAGLMSFEGANRLSGFFSDIGVERQTRIEATDEPVLIEAQLGIYENYQQAFNLNPDYLIRMKQIEQENIRVRFAKNQRLPQVDLRASFGANGLGRSPGRSWDDTAGLDYPAWSVGVEMRIPVTGGIRERNELDAAKLGKKRALVSLKEVEVQIANSLESGLHRVRTYRQNVRSYQNMADFHQKLLETQLERLEVGAIDSRTVLETEERLLEARMAVVESMVLYRRSLLELELIRGSMLEARHLELTREELRSRTAVLLQERSWSDEMLEEAQFRAFQALYPGPDMQERAIRIGRGRMGPLEAERLAAEIQDDAVQVLRKELLEGSPELRRLSPHEAELQERAIELLRLHMEQEK